MALSKAKTLSLEDCQCLLCMEFLIEPITLPCNHTMCKSCFKALLRKTFLSCPFCRTWVSSWARYHTHVNSLINKELWERIQAQYPEECRRRSPGEELPSLVLSDDKPVRVLSNPGELRKEYEEEMIKLAAERQATEEKQNIATQECIRQLLAQDMEEEKMWAEKLRLEEQRQREEEEAKKISMGEPATSPRKKKSKQKHCDSVPKFALTQSWLQSASQYDTVKDGNKTSVKTDSDRKKPTGQGMKTKDSMLAATVSRGAEAATVSRGAEIPNQGAINSRYALFYGYDAKMGTLENEASKPSCSNDNLYVTPKYIKSEEGTTHSSTETESRHIVSGMLEEIGNNTTGAKDKMSHPSSSKHTSKRNNQESSSEAAGEPGTPCEMPPKSSSEEDEAQLLITKRLIDLENLYFEKHQQEEQDRLFALELQRVLDEEERKMRGEKSTFPADISAKGESSKYKDI
ncbi:E3 ubiquitin-protein ligase RNF168 [Phodopus roborovskii]|uniref:E3 ubiquitin-protein ligase RNF168 n=1 Tax=Phodopus roborovskii TaxID=109678 RepID=UPI0021E3F408|nr:E3 ubiquitin-protein ligase RNF168 [Phodopus roborovskii]